VDFYRDRGKKDGYRNICKACDKEKDRLDKLYPPIKIDYSCEDGMKICRRCLVKKPIREFHKSKHSPDGLYFRCKNCVRESYNENRFDILEYKKEYYQDHKNDKKEYDKKYRHENKNKIVEDKKIYYYNNIEEISKKAIKYNLEHQQERREYLKKYNKTPAGKARSSRSFHKRRKNGKLVKNTLTDKQWNIILYDQQNNRCVGEDCGKEFSDNLPPTKDHIIPLRYAWFGLTFGNVRALCSSCNGKRKKRLFLGNAIDNVLVDSW